MMLKQMVLALSPWRRVLAHWAILGPKMGQKWVKNPFFKKSSWTIGDAPTSAFSPFSAYFDRV